MQLNFAQPLTNAGGTVPLTTGPNVVYSRFCVDDLPAICTPPPTTVSQERLAIPPNTITSSGFYYRVIVSGTVTAQ